MKESRIWRVARVVRGWSVMVTVISAVLAGSGSVMASSEDGGGAGQEGAEWPRLEAQEKCPSWAACDEGAELDPECEGQENGYRCAGGDGYCWYEKCVIEQELGGGGCAVGVRSPEGAYWVGAAVLAWLARRGRRRRR